MGMMWAVNPKSRRKGRKLSAKQIAAGFGGGKRRGRKRRAGHRARRRGRTVAVAAPVVHRRRRSAKRAMRRVGRRTRSMFRGAKGSFVNLLKAGVIGGAGAVAVNIAMGQVRGFLPVSMQSAQNADGTPNNSYFAAKAALALVLGTYGNRLPVVGKYAERMGEGALTVLAYQYLRPMVPASFTLGYFNPAPTQRPQVAGVGRYVSGTGAYASVPVRQGASAGKGARASAVLSAVGGR